MFGRHGATEKALLFFCTTSTDGVPNAVYVGSVSLHDEDKILIANNYFDKTLSNILSGSLATVLFITHEDKSYQCKGTVEYLTKGALYNEMKTWNPARHPGVGLVVISVSEIFNGSIKLL